MHQQPQGESIWGNINTCIEIALDIYLIMAKDHEGIEHTGIMAKKSTAENHLSKKAVEMGKEDGDWLCYDENLKDIPLYEVLQRRVAACKQVEAAAIKEMEEIKRGGKLSLTDYFGECNAPQESQYGTLTSLNEIRNGIYFTQDHEERQFAVHESIADSYLSPIAAEFGRRCGEYLFYDLETSAVALNELKNVFEEVRGVIISEESLNATLSQRFHAYTNSYNSIMPETYKIPEEKEAPAALFLSTQLALEESKTEQNHEQEERYDEVEDYGFEP